MSKCVCILKFTGLGPTLEGGHLIPPRHYSFVAFGRMGGGLMIHSVDRNQEENMVLITDEIVCVLMGKCFFCIYKLIIV